MLEVQSTVFITSIYAKCFHVSSMDIMHYSSWVGGGGGGGGGWERGYKVLTLSICVLYDNSSALVGTSVRR